MLCILITALALTIPLQRPHLTLAQGIVESHCNPYAIGKAKEKGAYQVTEKYWGKVPQGHTAQAQQAEQIMNELLLASGNDVSHALELYNGGESNKATRKYRQRVISKALELAMLGE